MKSAYLELKENKNLFKELKSAKRERFSEKPKYLTAPRKHGVYVISKNNTVLHVGRSYYGKAGLFQRMQNHLNGKGSSFVWEYKPFNHKANVLLRKKDYNFKYIKIANPRTRALFEAYATGILCPRYIGEGKKRR